MTNKLKLWILAVGALLLAASVCFSVMLLNRNARLKEQVEIASANNAAYQMRLEGQNNQILQFELSVDYLKHCNDSVSLKLTETLDKLKISEKKLKEANYMLSKFSKTDTVIITDTIFCEPDFWLDTVIGDKWVSTRLEMAYPSTIVITPAVTSEKQVFVYSSREIEGTPSKCFFIRWFQKKHTVTRVEIEESNPYITSEENVFIKTEE